MTTTREARKAATATENARRLAADLVAAHAEIHRLIAKLTEQVDAIDPDTANWGHVGELNYYAEKLRELTGEVG